MTVSNKSNKVEENGSGRVGFAGARGRPLGMVTERNNYQVVQGFSLQGNAAVKVAS